MKPGLPLVSGRYLEPMIGLADVELRKIASYRQSVDRLAGQRQWISIFLRGLVKTP